MESNDKFSAPDQKHANYLIGSESSGSLLQVPLPAINLSSHLLPGKI